MATFKKLFKKFLGFEEEEIDEKFNEEYAEETLYQEEVKPTVMMKKPMEVKLYPKTFGDACEVIEQLENGNTVLIDMNDVDIDTCKRITDFVLGAIYVLNGDVEKISKKVFRFWTIK